MKVPDKIYIGIQEDGFIDCGIQQTSTCPNEYICKGALIEWLEDNLQEACDEEGAPFEYYENGKINGKISAFEQVINKLHSM